MPNHKWRVTGLRTQFFGRLKSPSFLTLAALLLLGLAALRVPANTEATPSNEVFSGLVVLSPTPTATPPCPPSWNLVQNGGMRGGSNRFSDIDALSPDDVW